MRKFISSLYVLGLASLVLLFCLSCANDQRLLPRQGGDQLFELMPSEKTSVDFQNEIKESLYFNFINYSYVYNGGGIVTADFNNDGLTDLYFSANQKANKLFINQGDFQFEEVTASAGVADKLGWSTGVTTIDINNDGWLDIFISKSGSLKDDALRQNLLFVNQGDLTFKEEARAWGINDAGFGSQAYFFDFDRDGDLDLYQVNHRSDFKNNVTLDPALNNQITKHHSDQLYENKGTHFINVSARAGILNNAWGLSASVGDFNDDGWEDIYVANDFLQPDYLYINNKNGTFTEQAKATFAHLSQNSMGTDLADINQDGRLDLIVAEMSPEDHVRGKSNMPSMSTIDFENMVNQGYHHQYMTNTLQLSHGDSKYSDIAQLAGVSKTDWSWAPLLADFDEDGFNDLLVTNGILKDLSNSDYRNKIKKRITSGVKMTLDEALDMVPSQPLTNYVFQNNKDLTFVKKSKEWGITTPTFSNGAAYADLDNDGDLDLIINNMDDMAQLYKNNSQSNAISIELKGTEINVNGIGAKLEVWTDGAVQIKQQYLSRGYLSAISPRLHFGLGDQSTVDSLVVNWPDGKVSTRLSPDLSVIQVLDHADAIGEAETESVQNRWMNQIDATSAGIDFVHKENEFNDFDLQLLLPYKLSSQGPFMSSGDVSGDGKDDFFVGSSLGQSSKMYIQHHDGYQLISGPWEKKIDIEELQSVFIDYDSDGDLDLFVVNGGYETSSTQPALYRNNGNLVFADVSNQLPKIEFSGLVVRASDLDQDGDLDLFLGGRLVKGAYPLSPRSYFLENQNGRFVDATKKYLGQLDIGMITSAMFSDYDQDGDQDLITVGEWSAVQVFENNQGRLKLKSIPSLKKSTGLWSSIKAYDLDGDGDEDYLLGNLGLNSKYRIDHGKEFHIYASDFDQNGSQDIVLSNKYQDQLVPVRGLQCSSEQVPIVGAKFSTFNAFASSSLEDIYGRTALKEAFHVQADMLTSVWMRNDGNGSFELLDLPMEAQMSPIKDFEIIDLNQDGMVEIVAVGNLYETEVETVRFDASFGTVMNFNEGNFTVLDPGVTGFYSEGNARDILAITRKDGQHLLISSNEGGVCVFQN